MLAMSRDVLTGGGQVRQRTEFVGVLALVLLLLLRGLVLVSAMLVNVGMVMLRDELIGQADFAPGTYQIYEALDETTATTRAMQSIGRAMALDEDSLPARWALGRAALAVGDVGTATDALEALTPRVRQDPMLYQDVLTAFSYGGHSEEVIALYEAFPPLEHTQVISDVVALAYLERDEGVAKRSGDVTLARVAMLRPGDLYVNYQRWRAAIAAGNVEAVAAYSETLAYFPLEAVHPADERLLDYATEVIPALLEEGLWDREKTLNVLSFLVWQHNQATSVEQLLKRLIEHYPTEPEWSFYLAELYQRRGDLDQAKAMYQRVLEVDPGYAEAYLRLGMVAPARCEEQGASCEGLLEAAEWYKQYYEMAPDDLLVSKKLADIPETLGRFRGSDDSEVIQNILDSSISSISWNCTPVVSKNSSQLVFLGEDDLQGLPALRLCGFWFSENRGGTLYDYWTDIYLPGYLEEIELVLAYKSVFDGEVFLGVSGGSPWSVFHTMYIQPFPVQIEKRGAVLPGQDLGVLLRPRGVGNIWISKLIVASP